jgi:YidC/Oxa1 family membrane protein insertase
LLSPAGSPAALYAEFGWTAPLGQNVRLPGPETVWRQQGSASLGVRHPVTLVWDNGAGLTFHRTIAVDDQYLFTVEDEITNHGTAPVTLDPYALVLRHGTPQTLGNHMAHEGLIGVLGKAGLQKVTYAKIADKKEMQFDVTDGWLGITDKYWAAVLLPDTTAHLHARFSSKTTATVSDYQADYLLDPVTVAPGDAGSASARLFAGPKEVDIIDGYNRTLTLNRFDLLIDWGMFYFITKPMFLTLDFFYKLTGNFGIAILMVTMIIKGLFFPLANKSYASMAKMRSIQPKMEAIRERWPDDKSRQQQAMIELYRKENINPLAGCWPILIQIPIFFSLYKVLSITIEMRDASFFGWISDLSVPDPTTIFNLFGLLPWDPSHVPGVGPYLMIGAWPVTMGLMMWIQMQMTPSPPDSTQKRVFGWLPVIFTVMLARAPAGLVIYWTWNNFLSILQQGAIMSRHGADIPLFGQLKGTFEKLRLYGSKP